MDAFLHAQFLGQAVWLWLMFLAIVITLLVLDLGVLHRKNREIGVRESLLLSAGYMTLASIFGAWLWWKLGAQAGMEYFTGYVIELSLSMDNLFVIAMIFGFFAVPRELMHRVLFWGIIGVIVLRAVMIGVGAALIHQFEWILYVFGIFLVISGARMLFVESHGPDLSKNWLISWLKKHLRITPQLHGEQFFVRQPDPKTGKVVLWATPLFLALCMVEIADLVFAVDSVPAIFAITTDTFIVYTSNIFAILGLRAMYFALSALIHRFHYLKYALALVLIFVGTKIFLVNIVGKIPPAVSLSVTFGLIAGGVLVSLWKTRAGSGDPHAQPEPAHPATLAPAPASGNSAH